MRRAYPATKKGGDRKSVEAKSKNQTGDTPLRFSQDTAAKTGKSETSIKRDVQIAADIPKCQ